MIPHFVGLNAKERRNAILFMEKSNQAFGDRLQEVEAPGAGREGAPLRAWMSKEFCVQLFREGPIYQRLSVNRAHVDPATLRWVDGITWDDLQRLKSEAGFGDREAVEVYPPDGCVVDVANIRHLWILPARMPFSWGSSP